jgi:hypothetical protein
MLVFLAEMKDFKSILKLLTRGRPVAKFSRFLRKLRREMILKDYWDATKGAAALHLTNEFAIKPFVRDMGTIISQCGILAQEAQQKFADAGRETNTRYYSELLYSNRTGTSSYETYVGTVESTNFNACMEYQYNYKLRSSLAAFTQYWGLLNSPTAMWELMPFSFVVDYFLNIGDSIKAAQRDKNVHLNWSQYCESLLTIKSQGYHNDAAYLYGPMIVGDCVGSLEPQESQHNLYSGSKSSLYTRRVRTPFKGMVVPKLRKPSSKQKLNLLALARAVI